MFAVGNVDAPAPISKDDPSVQFAWYWPDAWEAVSKHKAHLLASVSGGADAKRRAALHGQLVAAVIDATKDAVAVHWASSDSLWPAALVAENIAPGEQKPAISDMHALRNVFDTNHDGKVSASDANFSQFKLIVSNADGTKTLAQADIASSLAHLKRHKESSRSQNDQIGVSN